MILYITAEDRRYNPRSQVYLVDREGFGELPKGYVVIDPLAPSMLECFSAEGRLFLSTRKYQSYDTDYYFPIPGFFLAIEREYIREDGPTWWWPNDVP